MTRFNPPAPTIAKTTNLAGGTAYKQDGQHELASLILTSFLADKFYRRGSDELDRLRALIAEDAVFAAQAAVYARNEHGMRSVSHVIAGEVVEHVKGEAWVKDFIRAVVRRPDDMTEIVAYRAATYGLHPLPNSLKKGLAAAFGKFDSYQLGKYRAEDKTVKLVDVANLVRPRPTDRNRAALEGLVNGTLRQEDTWENRLSSGEDKAAVWHDLLATDKLGYFALLRNLRNIALQADDETFSLAVTQLVDADRIQKSLVLPFRYWTAYKELSSPSAAAWAYFPKPQPKRDDIPSARRTKLLQALSIAASHAVANIPDLPGRTLISLDSSGSMASGRVGGQRSQTTVAEIGSLFAAALLRRLGGRAGLILFDTSAHHLPVNPSDSVLTIAGLIQQHMRGGGTDMDLAFATGEYYDRVIILSDMQAWTNGEWANREQRLVQQYYGSPVWTPAGTHRPAVNAYDEYKQRTGADPDVYSFDLTGYGTIQFPRERCYQLAGWSDKVFSLMGLLGADRHAMINTIRQVQF